MAQQPRVLAVLSEDQNSILSTHIKGFTTTSNSMSRASHALLWHNQKHPQTHAYTHRCG